MLVQEAEKMDASGQTLEKHDKTDHDNVSENIGREDEELQWECKPAEVTDS